MTKKQLKLIQKHGLKPDDFDVLRVILGGRKQTRNHLVLDPSGWDRRDRISSALNACEGGTVKGVKGARLYLRQTYGRDFQVGATDDSTD